jgi:methylated-DNA-protein-cysteine methyltransferase-like protein
MNHSKWISVTLDDTLDDSDVMDLIDESFRLTNVAAGVLNEQLIREALEIADNIPPGRVMSYGQIAAMMGRPQNARLIGKIMSMQDRYGSHPCHRVVNSAGRTVPGWTEQRELLEAEGVVFKENGNVDMRRFRME